MAMGLVTHTWRTAEQWLGAAWAHLPHIPGAASQGPRERDLSIGQRFTTRGPEIQPLPFCLSLSLPLSHLAMTLPLTISHNPLSDLSLHTLSPSPQSSGSFLSTIYQLHWISHIHPPTNQVGIASLPCVQHSARSWRRDGVGEEARKINAEK